MLYKNRKKLKVAIVLFLSIYSFSLFARNTDGICNPALYEGKDFDAYTLERINELCNKTRSILSIRTERVGNRITITKTVNGVTTHEVIENVPEGYDASIDINGNVVLIPPFKPSNKTLTALGEDFNWRKLNNDEKKELDLCINNDSCSASAYKASLEFRNFHSDSIDLAKCVASNSCDLEAYIVSRNFRDFHDDALEFSECIKANKCDMKAYKDSRNFRDFRDDAFALSKCVSEKKCDLEAFKSSRAERQFFDDAFEISKCVKRGECDIEVYLKSIHSRSFHDDAFENSKKFKFQNPSDNGKTNESLSID